MKRQLLLIDGSSYIFRAFYGIKANLTNRDGMPTNAILGFKNMLLNLLKEESATHCVMVFDKPGPTFRNDLYSEYKANRSKAPDELRCQIQPIHELCECLNLPILALEGYEADDIIGSLVHRFSSDIQVTIISGDKDLTQLVTDDVHMLDTMSNKRYTPETVQEKFGVPPEMIHEYLALVGDTSDNIPGAQGIGPKTAVKLFDQFGNIEGLYQNTDKLKGKQKEKIEASKEDVQISLKLTKICCELKFDSNLEDYERKVPDLERVKEFYDRMNMRPDEFILNHPDAESGATAPEEREASTVDHNRYELITTSERLEALRDIFMKQSELTMDLETTSLHAVEAEIVGISFAWQGGNPVYIPVGHTEETPQIPREQALEILRPVFENEKIRLIGQNIKYEIMVFSNYGIKLAGAIHDTMLQSYLLFSGSHRHNLDELAQRYLNHQMIKYEDVTGKGKKQIPFAEVSLQNALNYAAEDSDATFQLHEKLFPKIEEEGLTKLYEEMELPLCRCLAKMETTGVKINSDYLKELCEQLRVELTAVEQEIYEMAGKEFNINSPKQLGDVLFEDMGITIGKKKTKTGYSTNASVLEKIALYEPIGEYLLAYRSKSKLVNTYLEVLPTLVSSKTGRIHTSYNQAIAATGRLSSKDPNLQNIPIKGADGRKIRAAFIPEEGYTLIAADYSQIELRFLAHLSEDENLINVYQSEGDIHTETAAAVYGISHSEVTEEQRRAAKAINFGIIYGMGAFRLAQEIKVSNKQAKQFIDAYFEKYPKIRTYMDETVAFCKEHQYVETMFGRKREISDINAKNKMAQAGAERVAINSGIQGSAADLIKMAMIQIQQKLDSMQSSTKMIMQVHDELVFEVKDEEVSTIVPIIKEIMESVISLKVPLVVEVGQGQNWQEAH